MSYKEYTLRIYDNGAKEYFNDKGQRHREDGPALEYANEDKYYYINGLLHREDGPAIEWPGNERYFINGEEICKQAFLYARKIYARKKDPCEGKIVEFDGKKYKLISI